jgi:hypothetical protein
MALHETPARSDEWYTPAYVFEALGEVFLTDVAFPEHSCPAERWCESCITRDSLDADWRGFVWMNPPFGRRNGIAPWLDKFFGHGLGVALTPDRTSAPWWQAAARRADALLFVAPKIKFLPGPGAVSSSPAQGTTLLAAGGPCGSRALPRGEERPRPR